MAIEYGDGKAGQYAKSQVQKRFERVVAIVMLGATIGSMTFGIVLGFLLAHQLAFRFQGATVVVRVSFRRS